jgi:hypothetical protein
MGAREADISTWAKTGHLYERDFTQFVAVTVQTQARDLRALREELRALRTEVRHHDRTPALRNRVARYPLETDAPTPLLHRSLRHAHGFSPGRIRPVMLHLLTRPREPTLPPLKAARTQWRCVPSRTTAFSCIGAVAKIHARTGCRSAGRSTRCPRRRCIGSPNAGRFVGAALLTHRARRVHDRGTTTIFWNPRAGCCVKGAKW